MSFSVKLPDISKRKLVKYNRELDQIEEYFNGFITMLRLQNKKTFRVQRTVENAGTLDHIDFSYKKNTPVYAISVCKKRYQNRIRVRIAPEIINIHNNPFGLLLDKYKHMDYMMGKYLIHMWDFDNYKKFEEFKNDLTDILMRQIL